MEFIWILEQTRLWKLMSMQFGLCLTSKLGWKSVQRPKTKKKKYFSVNQNKLNVYCGWNILKKSLFFNHVKVIRRSNLEVDKQIRFCHSHLSDANRFATPRHVVK